MLTRKKITKKIYQKLNIQNAYEQIFVSKTLKKIKSRLFISYSQNNSTIKIYSKNVLLSKINYEWEFEFEKKFRKIAKNVDIITNIFENISKLENQCDFNNCNSIIIIKNRDEIVNILKRHLENNISKKKIIFVYQNKAIFNDNNHVCLNWTTYYDNVYLIYLSKKKQLIFKIISKKKTNYAKSKKLRVFQLINLFKH